MSLEARATGWKITGRGTDWTAEKNRFIFTGPSKEFVLKLAEKYDAKMSAAMPNGLPLRSAKA
jgi:hypothetical protein